MTAAPVSATGFGGGFTSQSIAVDGVNLNVTVGGSGPTDRADPRLRRDVARCGGRLAPHARARAFTVIAPDLPGIGGSSIPESGLDMTHVRGTRPRGRARRSATTRFAWSGTTSG